MLICSYASPLDQQLPNSSNESDHYDKKPYSESEHSTASCCTNCKYFFAEIYKYVTHIN